MPQDAVIEGLDNYSSGIRDFKVIGKNPTLSSDLIQNNLPNESQKPLFFLKHVVRIYILGLKSDDYLVKTRQNFRILHRLEKSREIVSLTLQTQLYHSKTLTVNN